MKKLTILLFSFLLINNLSAQTVDSIIDIRDSQVYKIVKIGQQWWMQENLNIGNRIDVGQNTADNGIIERYCYNNNDSLCNIYGGLYQWDEMMDYNPSDNGNPGINQGICPVGWHLPTDNEWNELTYLLGGVSIAGGMLKETGTTHWSNPNTGATNQSGFTALPGGYFYNYTNDFGNMSIVAFFWTSTESYDPFANRRELYYNDSGVGCYFGNLTEESGLSVRCLRDHSQFSYLTIADKNLSTISKLDFINERIIDTIIIINSASGKTIKITSIHTATPVFNLTKSSADLSPGDSIHLTVTFNPPVKGIHYFDTLRIESNDPYYPVISVPLMGYIPEIDSIIDIRDSQVYKVVKIGQQWWMQENLNIGIRIDGTQDAADNEIIEKFCYNDETINCKIYGGLYLWDEMMDYLPSDNSNPGITRGVCPAGWHLPTDNEWNELTDLLEGESVAGGKLKETGIIHWASPNTGAIDEIGFTALPGGYCSNYGYFLNLSNYAYFWSTTEYDNENAWYRNVYFNNINVSRNYLDNGHSFSVRCLRDSDQFGYLTISDNNLDPVSDMRFYGYNNSEEIIIINSGTGKTINLSSINTGNSAFSLNNISSLLSPGDSIHLNIVFNPPVKGNYYFDTLNIESDDPFKAVIIIPLQGYEPEIDSIIDIRDNQVYKVVKIGQQWWMQENLNIGTRLNGSQDDTDNGIIEKYCYGNNTINCNIYGGLYRWNEMMDYYPSDVGNPGITRGVCPAGWHLPTESEWTEMTNCLGDESVAGGKLKETGTIHWNSRNTGATNESGFTALGGGFLYYDSFLNMGSWGTFYSSTESSGFSAWYWQLASDNSGVGHNQGYSKDIGFSVRCLRDSVLFGNLTILDINSGTFSDLNFYGNNVSEEIIIINSGASKTINISSIYTKNSAFNLNHKSAILTSGDSIHLTITFNPPVKDVYPDTLFITSNDKYKPLIAIPLNGTFPPEVSISDSTNISCNGYSDGSATVTPSLGTPPYEYQWDDPASTNDSAVTGLSANIWYRITLTDNLGWTVRDSIRLSQPDPLDVWSDFYSGYVCPGSSTGFINLNYSGGTPLYTFSWSNGAETQNVSGLPSGSYSILISDNNGCENSENFIINNAIPYESEKICIVTVDLMSGKNIIVWEKTPNAGIASYKIYREAGIGEYEYIGSKNASELSIFRDETADPESRAYLYKITITDSCGNESDRGASPYHKPSFLQFVSDVGGVNLTWTNYEIEGINLGEYLTSYVIYRGTDSTGLTEYQTVGSINNFTDKDPDALARRYYYRVAGTLKNPCYPSSGKKDEPGPYTRSMSNIEDNRLAVGLDKLSAERLSINPVPFSDRTKITFDNPDGHSYTMLLMDLSGKVCRIVDKISTSEYILEREDLGAGFYIIELRGDKVYRGRIIVE
jgi:uncharacterized protein (TIGR02145 family)